jgi:phosphoglycolate phosphatase
MQNNSALKKTPARHPTRLPKAILFDWDNTLVDTWSVCFDSFNIALQAIGRSPITPQEFWNQPHLSARDSHHHFGDQVEKWESTFYEAINKRHLEELVAFEGAESLLKNLKERDLYVGIVSNKTGTLLRKEVAHLGWQDHFHAVIGSRDAEQDKPSHLPVLAALKPSMLCPTSHDVWFIGDSIVDVQCARASGCIPLVVGDGNASLEEDVIHVKDCQGIITLIESL